MIFFILWFLTWSFRIFCPMGLDQLGCFTTIILYYIENMVNIDKAKINKNILKFMKILY